MDLTNGIINQASAMSTARLQSEMSVRTFKKVLDFQEQAALCYKASTCNRPPKARPCNPPASAKTSI